MLTMCHVSLAHPGVLWAKPLATRGEDAPPRGRSFCKKATTEKRAHKPPHNQGLKSKAYLSGIKQAVEWTH